MANPIDNFDLRGAFTYLVEDEDEGGMGLTRTQAENQIARRLATEANFDYSGATEAGFNNEQIISKLTGIEKQGFIETVGEGVVRGGLEAVAPSQAFLPGMRVGAALGSKIPTIPGKVVGIIGGGLIGGVTATLAASLADAYVGLSKGVGDFLLGEEEDLLPSDQAYREGAKAVGSLLTFSGALRAPLSKIKAGSYPTGQTGATLESSSGATADFGSKQILANLRKYNPEAKTPFSVKALEATERQAGRMATTARGSKRDYFLRQEAPVALGFGVGAGLAEQVDPGDAVTSFFTGLVGGVLVPQTLIGKGISATAGAAAHPIQTVKAVGDSVKRGAQGKAQKRLENIFSQVADDLAAPGKAKAVELGVPYNPAVHSPEVNFNNVTGPAVASMIRSAQKEYDKVVPGVKELMSPGTTGIKTSDENFASYFAVLEMEAMAMAQNSNLKKSISDSNQEAMGLSASMLRDAFASKQSPELIRAFAESYTRSQEKALGNLVFNKMDAVVTTIDKFKAGTQEKGAGSKIIVRELEKLRSLGRGIENRLYSEKNIAYESQVDPQNTIAAFFELQLAGAKQGRFKPSSSSEATEILGILGKFEGVGEKKVFVHKDITVGDAIRVRSLAGDRIRELAATTKNKSEIRVLQTLKDAMLKDLEDPNLTAASEALVRANSFSAARNAVFTNTYGGKLSAKLKFEKTPDQLLEKLMSTSRPNKLSDDITGLQKMGSFFEDMSTDLRKTGNPELIAYIDENLPVTKTSAKNIETNLVNVIRGAIMEGAVVSKPRVSQMPPDVRDQAVFETMLTVDPKKMETFLKKYEAVAQKNPVVKQLFDDFKKGPARTQATLDAFSKDRGALAQRKQEKDALSEVLMVDSPVKTLSNIFASDKPKQGLNNVLKTLNLMKTSKVPVYSETAGKNVPAKELYGEARKGLINSLIQVAQEKSITSNKEIYTNVTDTVKLIDAKKFRQFFFETSEVYPSSKGLPTVIQTLAKAKLLSPAEVKQIDNVTELMFNSQNQLLFMQQLPEQAKKGRNPFSELVAGFFGAQVGAGLVRQTGGYGSIQIPGFTASYSREMLLNSPNMMFTTYMSKLFQPGGFQAFEEMLEKANLEAIAAAGNASNKNYGANLAERLKLKSPVTVMSPIQAINEDRPEKRQITPPPQPISQASPSVNPMQSGNQRARYAAMFPLDPASSLIREKQAQGIGSLPRP